MMVTAIPAFEDNYIWVIEEGEQAIIVDPGESEAVIEYVLEQELELVAILLTHEHGDHVNGVAAVAEAFPNAVIIGPQEVSHLAGKCVADGDEFELLHRTFRVVKTAGHTQGHISFVTDEALFCGDALFSAGCGRVFTGDYQAQYEALQFFKTLEARVHVYAGHEYTLTNLYFALSLEPENAPIQQAIKTVEGQREKDQPSLPTTIGLERQINPFLRANSLEQFIERRNARDSFRR